MIWVWIISFAFIASMAYAAVSGAPWVPTWKRDIERARALLNLKSAETFVELGCGDGRVTVALARGLDVDAVGIELSLLQWMAANVRRVLTRSWNTRFVFGNVFSRDLSSANAVYLFLMPETNKKIRSKLEADLKPGSRVVSYVWPIPGWTAHAVDELPNAPRLFLYVR